MSFHEFLELFSSEKPEKILTNILVKSNQEPLKKGAQFGWVMALEMPLSVYRDFFSNDDHSQEVVDESFINYYLADFNNTMKVNLVRNIDKLPESLQVLLNEAIWAFENDKFQICIPALFSVIEGALVDISNQGKRKEIKYKGGIDKIVVETDSTFGVLPLISISWFLDFAFGKSDFDQSNFTQINRHWSQHGRYLEVLDVKPVLQLFGAVALILFHYELE